MGHQLRTIAILAALALPAYAVTDVYYSVGQNNSDHKSPATTVGISSGTATFDFAPTAPNMGVGDDVNVGGTHYFIEAKLSGTQWTVTTPTGAQPADVSAGTTLTSISHAFVGIQNAFNGSPKVTDAAHLNNTTLTAIDTFLHLACYNDTGALDTTTAITAQNITTDSTHWVLIYTPVSTVTEANSNQRHSGFWDPTKFNINVSNAIAMSFTSVAYIWMDGLQITNNSPSADARYVMNYTGPYTAGANEQRLSNSIVKGHGNPSWFQRGVSAAAANTVFTMWNVIVYGIGNPSNANSVGLVLGGTSANLNNVTAIGGNQALQRSSGAIQCKNMYAGGSVGLAYSTALITKTNCASHDTSGSPGLQSIAADTTTFRNVTTGSEDYRLSTIPGGSPLVDKGALNITDTAPLNYANDIEGQARLQGMAMDIGADEYSPPGDSMPPSISAFTVTAVSSA